MLEMLLAFATGAQRIPALGFHENPQVEFHHLEEIAEDRKCTAEFPHANTCSLTISLPILDNYELFKERMVAAITQCTTFSAS